MRPRSSNLPQVGVVFTLEVLLEITHQVLQHIHMLAARAHYTEALHEHGPVLDGHFCPVPLARVCNKAAREKTSSKTPMTMMPPT